MTDEQRSQISDLARELYALRTLAVKARKFQTFRIYWDAHEVPKISAALTRIAAGNGDELAPWLEKITTFLAELVAAGVVLDFPEEGSVPALVAALSE